MYVEEHVSPLASTMLSTHLSVVAPLGSTFAQTMPSAPQVVSQSPPGEDICHSTPGLLHATSTGCGGDGCGDGGCGGDVGGGGGFGGEEGSDGGDGGKGGARGGEGGSCWQGQRRRIEENEGGVLEH